MSLNEVKDFLASASDDERRALLRVLREEYRCVLHPLEAKWTTTAEAVLEAISQSPDITQRGVRGILAEATFRTTVVPEILKGWDEVPFEGETAYDLLLDDGSGVVRVQVKLQRKERQVPKLYFKDDPSVFVVETQRTRSGKKRKKKGSKGDSDQERNGLLLAQDVVTEDQEATRPYRVDEFDVLAVCLHPSTSDWRDFAYCAVSDLLVRKASPGLLEVLQPVYLDESHGWSKDFNRAVSRFRG